MRAVPATHRPAGRHRRRVGRRVFALMTGLILALGLCTAIDGVAVADPPNMMPLPPGMADAIDRSVPPPPIPRRMDIPPRAAADGFDHRTLELREAILPSPTGDRFFDRWPADLASMRPGEIIGTRDVTATAGPVVTVPLRSATQIKFRSTDATGAPIYGTATLLIPRRGAGASDRTTPSSMLVNNLPIDSLGAACTPGYTLAHGFSIATGITDLLPPATQFALHDGHAVLVPDHQGPRMAYAEPTLAGHVILDAIRAASAVDPGGAGFGRIAMTGYSGGAIATHGAVKLMGDYAPELVDRVVGAALGGVPADFRMLVGSMNANLATGLFHAATFGIARERTELLSMANRPARWLASSPLKNVCVIPAAVGGATFLPMQLLTTHQDPFDSPLAQRIYRITRMSERASAVPLLIYHGTHEWWIPAAGARALFREQCAHGTSVAYREIFGEHVTGALLGFPVALEWINRRLAGEPAVDECGRRR